MLSVVTTSRTVLQEELFRLHTVGLTFMHRLRTKLLVKGWTFSYLLETPAKIKWAVQVSWDLSCPGGRAGQWHQWSMKQKPLRGVQDSMEDVLDAINMFESKCRWTQEGEVVHTGNIVWH